MHLGGFVGDRSESVHQPVTGKTVGAPLAARFDLVMDARRQRLFGIAVAVDAGRARVVGFVRILGLAGMTVGAARAGGTVHGRRPLRLVDDQALFADVVDRAVTLEADLFGTQRASREERQDQPGGRQQETTYRQTRAHDDLQEYRGPRARKGFSELSNLSNLNDN